MKGRAQLDVDVADLNGGLVADGELVIAGAEPRCCLCRLIPHSTACRCRKRSGSNVGGRPPAEPFFPPVGLLVVRSSIRR